jgi:hypothetical protein
MKLPFPIRYIPNKLTKRDKNKQRNMLIKSRKLYKMHKYYKRKPISSYKNKKSSHVSKARKIYGIDNISPNKNL